MLDVSATEVRIVFLNSNSYIVQAQAVLRQKLWIHLDLELLGFSAPSVDVAHSRYRSKLVLDLPFMDVLEFHRTQISFEGVLVKLAERCCRRTKHRLNPLGQLSRGLLQPLIHEFAGHEWR